MVKNQHDLLNKELFSNPEMVAQLIKEFTPKGLAELLDLSTLKLHNGSYITPNDKEKFQDMVWSAQMKGQEKPVEAYLYILLEFQSAPDRSMPLRMAHYTLSFYENLIKTKKLNLRKNLLPPIFPLVLYSGERNWKVPLKLEDLIYKLPEFLTSYQVRQSYFLIDEQRLDSDELQKKTEILSRLIFMKQSSNMLVFLKAISMILSHPDFERMKPIVERAMIRYTKIQQLPITQQEIYELLEDEQMSTPLYRSFVEEAEKHFINLGREEGIEQGMLKGIQSTVLKMLHNGKLSIEQISNILELPVEQVEQFAAEAKQ